MATKKKTSAGSSKATSQKLAKIEVFATPTKPKHECLNNTFKFFKYGIESANHLWEVYKNLTKQRGKGAPSHANQDVLRAMFIMAAATLDAALKKLIIDSLELLIASNTNCLKEVSKIIQRDFLKNLDKKGDIIAKAFLSEHPKQILIAEVIEQKTGTSLQSTDQIRQVCNFFGIESPPKEKLDILDKAFKARNQIIHRLDGDPDHPTRYCKQRKIKEMQEFTQTTFYIVEYILNRVEKSLNNPTLLKTSALEDLGTEKSGNL